MSRRKGFRGKGHGSRTGQDQQENYMLMDLERSVFDYLESNKPWGWQGGDTAKLEWNRTTVAKCENTVYNIESNFLKGSYRSSSRKLQNFTSIEQQFNIGEISTPTNKLNVTVYDGILPGPVAIPIDLPKDVTSKDSSLGKQFFLDDRNLNEYESYTEIPVRVPAGRSVQANLTCDEVVSSGTLTQRMRVTGEIIARFYRSNGMFYSQTVIPVSQLFGWTCPDHSKYQPINDGVEITIQATCSFHLAVNCKVVLTETK